MNKFARKRWLISILLLAILTMACGGIPSIPGIPTFPPRPGTANIPTGSSPMSGDWNADTEFGHIAFTVDPDGNNVVTTVITMSNFTCGSTYLSTDTQILNSWSISNGEFSSEVDLDDSHFLTMTIDGTYDEAAKTFSGSWEEDSHGTICSGEWTATPRK